MSQSPVDLFYVESGSGVPVILIHGFPFNHTIWEETANKLAAKARLIRPDLRGHGSSPVPDGIYSMEAMAADILLVMDKLNIEKAVLVGHSMGGYICLALMEQYPHRCLGLGLVCTQAGSDSPERRQGRYQTIELLKDAGVEALAGTMPGQLTRFPAIRKKIREMILGTSKMGLVGSLQGMAERKDRSCQLGSINIPCLVIAGDQDNIISVDIASAMVERIPGSILKVIKGAGHMPMLEFPAQLSVGLESLIDQIIKS